MPALIARAAAFAALLLMSGPAFAAEPVRQIGIYVQPYYEAARTPNGQPRVAVGRQFSALLASNRREDIVTARDRIAAKPGTVTPMTMMVLAIRLYDVGLRDDAVFWFYIAKERAIVMSEVLDMRVRGLAQADEAARNFAMLAGPVINGYAFCDPAKQQKQHAQAIAWVEQHPYEVMFMQRLPAQPGDRGQNHKRALANAKARAEKERAYFADAKNAAEFAAARRRNEADAKFCWK
jgi:hypothetical protein